jgi:hypothetical protein
MISAGCECNLGLLTPSSAAWCSSLVLGTGMVAFSWETRRHSKSDDSHAQNSSRFQWAQQRQKENTKKATRKEIWISMSNAAKRKKQQKHERIRLRSEQAASHFPGTMSLVFHPMISKSRPKDWSPATSYQLVDSFLVRGGGWLHLTATIRIHATRVRLVNAKANTVPNSWGSLSCNGDK